MSERPPPRARASSSSSSSKAHPIALVRGRLMQAGLERLLLLPISELVERLLPFTRRGARLAERLGADRPALTLSSALAELSSATTTGSDPRRAGALPAPLVDKLAYALHRLIDVEGRAAPAATTAATTGAAGSAAGSTAGPATISAATFTWGDAIVPGPLPAELKALDDALGDLVRRLRPLVDDAALAVVRRRRARVSLDDGPPAGFFYTEDPGPVPPGLLLAVDAIGVGARGLAFVGVRGPLLSAASQLNAAERILDVVREPLFDEGARVRRLAGGRFGSLLQALDALVVVDDEHPRLVWRVAADGATLRPFVRGDAPPLDGATSPRRIDELVRTCPLATEHDRVIASTLAARERFDGVVARALVGHPFVELPDRRALHVVASAVQVDVDDQGRVRLAAGGSRLDVASLGDDGAAFAVDAARGRLVVVHVDGPERALARAVARLGDEPLPGAVLGDVAARLKKSRLDVALPSSLRGEQVAAAQALVVKAAFDVAQDGSPAGARFSMVARPLLRGATFLPGEGPRVHFGESDDGAAVWCERELEHERRVAGRIIAAAGATGDDVDGPYGFTVLSPARALAVASRLSLRNDVVLAVAKGGPRLSRAQATDMRVQWTRRTDWLGLDGSVTLPDGARADVGALLHALREGRRYVVLGKSDIVVIDDALADALGTLAQFLAPDGSLARGTAVVVDDANARLVEAGAVVDGGEGWQLVDESIARARDVDGTAPAAITATLRPYQQEALRFLRRLAALGTGGVLADDMGLGKTLVTLCLLVDRAALGPQLVVAPTSLGFNWQGELGRFSPGALRALVLADAASADERLRVIAGAGAGDVVIASYGVVARDIADDRLSTRRFATLVIDEAQAVKNASTARAVALRRVQADVRLALTGTPLENHTGELWGILDLVAPGLFGSFPQWKARWAQPIEKDDDDDRKARLARALRPFLLRRTKAAVARDLPPRTDVVRLLQPSADEHAAYERLRTALVLDVTTSRRKKRKQGAPDDNARTLTAGEQRVQLLAALTRLRLCACHPGFVEDIDDGHALAPSTKQQALVELLRELAASGHRALVFSQFVRHLRVAERAVRDAGLRTIALTGDTPTDERRRLVERFQNAAGTTDDDVDAFFISLKAGGFGLNLTRADYVVHLDPWWNPAVEDQASDRAHRIGQTLPVTVVRLVMRDSIEEAILSLHARKRDLADAVLAGTERAGSLTIDDLERLITTTRRHAGDDASELSTVES